MTNLLSDISFAGKAATLPARWQHLPEPERGSVLSYLKSDRTPLFSPGYTAFKERLIIDLMDEPAIAGAFSAGGPLPQGFGKALDERIVEYPWVFARLPPAPVAMANETATDLQTRQLIVDAGSTFNKQKFLSSPILANRPIVIATMETDWIAYNPLISYLFTDLRRLLLRDAVADVVVCISTLEHVGFTYEYKTYSRHRPWPLAKPESYREAVREFDRVLRPQGRLLLTLPFGRREDHGWLQQFDMAMIEDVKSVFGGDTVSEVCYRYVDGWQVARPEDCAELSYFNIHETGKFEEPGLVAARAIYCMELRKADEQQSTLA